MQKGRVKSTTGLNLRDKPNGEKTGILGFNEEFSLVDQVTFYRIKTLDGRVGYVHGDYVEKVPTMLDIPGDVELRDEAEGEFSPEFKSVIFSDPHFIGDTLTADQDFVPGLKRLATYADQCHLKIWVTSSLRALNNQVRGAIVKPATNSCHHIGHAIDMNLFHDGTLYNSKKLVKENHINLPEDVRQFFKLVRADDKLRWGGDFGTPDPVHIDDNFFHKQRLFFKAKLDSRVIQANT